MALLMLGIVGVRFISMDGRNAPVYELFNMVPVVVLMSPFVSWSRNRM